MSARISNQMCLKANIDKRIENLNIQIWGYQHFRRVLMFCNATQTEECLDFGDAEI